MSDIIYALHHAAHNVRSKLSSNKDEAMLRLQHTLLDHDPKDFVDLYIHFIGAQGLPKMDVVGTADPFFTASLDDQINYISSVKSRTLDPVWHERWRVKNVPKHAVLEIKVYDKDEGRIYNDFIGKATLGVDPGTTEHELVGPTFKLRQERGRFWVEIESQPCEESDPKAAPYEFDGPIRYSRHTSPTAGRLTNVNEARLYSTWKLYLKGVKKHFGDTAQHWNTNYKAAQAIFQGPSSIAVRRSIKAAHDILYSRGTANGFGVIEDQEDIISILHSGGASRPNQHQSDHQVALAHRVKPALYTYAISCADNSLRFSETGAAFFVDFASKHALHAKCAEYVWYSGEFHPRPKGGWENFSDDMKDEDVEWELLIDNNSGTYAPDKEMLPTLQALLEYNFPGFAIRALDREDEDLKKSVEACKEYAIRKREVKAEDFEPHVSSPDEEPLSKCMWNFWKPGQRKDDTSDEGEEMIESEDWSKQKGDETEDAKDEDLKQGKTDSDGILSDYEVNLHSSG